MLSKLEKRFWSKVDRSDKCWVWIASCYGGYGNFKLNKKTRKAHRVSWELANGPIPNGLCVLHKCDNPPCVNPDHLFLGTQADNMKDKEIKNRSKIPDNTGENNGQCKLREEDVINIRDALDKGVKQKIIADHFNIKQQSVSDIKRRKNWKHL